MGIYLKWLTRFLTPVISGLSFAAIFGLFVFLYGQYAYHNLTHSNGNTEDYWSLSKQLSEQAGDGIERISLSVLNEDPVINSQPKSVFSEFTSQDISKGQVDWQAPENLGDLGWTDKDVFDGSYDSEQGRSYGVKYLKVGAINSGAYAGYEIILVASHIMSDGPVGIAPGIMHYIRRNQEVILLPNADSANGDEKFDISLEKILKEREEYPKQVIYAPNEKVDIETRIVELALYPQEFVGRSEREVLVKNTYAGPAFFSDEHLKSVFSHPTLGQLWMAINRSEQKSVFELNSYLGFKTDTSGKKSKVVRVKQYYDPIADGGFYFKRPDGITVSYRLKFDIFDQFDREGVLQATWNDGTQNDESYEEYPSGCGLSAYAYDVTGAIKPDKDLVVIGHTVQGDSLFGYKDTKNQQFKDMYLYYKNGYSILEDKSLTEEQFLALRPAVFWRDPFDRILKFQHAKLIPLAECGKPVVYLYPQQTTAVSVQVFPDEGVRISEPAYGHGWRVVAQPDGTLTNLGDQKQYRSLFWEGGSNVLYRASDQGFMVANQDLNGFFDDKLMQAGLVGREIDDFKEFWIPKMRELGMPYYFVTFLPRAQIDALAPLSISPKPDTVIRLMMDYEGRETYQPVVGYALRAPKREGFTVVEWGGRLQQ